MSDVFISYSRVDKTFVEQLREAFLHHAQKIWIDWESIPASQSWWEEIKRGIATANNFVLVMSPNSMASPICQMEIEEARRLGKRIIPVFHAQYDRETCLMGIAKRLAIPDSSQDITRELWGNRQAHLTFDDNQRALAPINYFFFTPDDPFDDKFTQLLEIIRTDFAHKETHTRIGLRAETWYNRERDVSFLLDGEELRHAEIWMTQATTASKMPPVTDLQADYIRASRADEDYQRQRLNTIRRARLVASVLAGVMLLFAVGASLVGVNAVNNTNIALTRAFVADELSTQAVFNLNTVNVQISTAEARLEQAEIDQDIVTSFSDAVLNYQNPDMQIEQMNRMVEQYPNEARAYLARGLIYAQSGHYEESIADFTRAIDLDPTIINLYTNRGHAYLQLGDYDHALPDFDEAVRLNPSFGDAYLNRGITYIQLGQYDQAIADFDSAIAINPRDFDAYYQRGVAYNLLDDTDRAIADFTQAIDINPFDTRPRNDRAIVYANLDMYDLSIADFNRIIEIEPQNPIWYENRGILYYLLAIAEADPLTQAEHAQNAIADFRVAESLGSELSDDMLGFITELEALLAEATPTS